MKLRTLLFLFLLGFGLFPLILAITINLPLVLNHITLFYQKAYLQNLRADFRDLDEHLASRHEMIRLLAKLPEPGLILGERGDGEQIDLARARYTAWINQILSDQRDIVHILFLDTQGEERFWLERDPKTLKWHPTLRPPTHPSEELLQAALRMQPGGVMVSRIRIEPIDSSKDPRQRMMLSLVSPIGRDAQQAPQGLVVLTIDVGGLAQFYRDTLWVNHNGSYLHPGLPMSDQPEAFQDFPGLQQIFAKNKLALWKGPQGEQFLWVPMFITENAEPLWVGRKVDPSPIDNFRNALILRVLGIVLLLLLVITGMARWIAKRVEHFGKELTLGLRRVVRDGERIQFDWQGPQELRELGQQLSALAEQHVAHLRAAREHTRALERSNRYKSEFLANVSHELRTPLNSILLLSKLLAESNQLSPTHRRQAQVIHEAGSDLIAMIDNILDISRIEAGQVAVHLEWIALRSLVEEVLDLVSPLFEEKQLYLRLVQEPDAPPQIYSDRNKIRQILKNFLSNAAKFTDRGGVTVILGKSKEESRPVALSVVDTGIGIPEDKQAVIFEAFQQADGSTHRRYGGTGLGLSISCELAQLLGGTIQVESQEGAGSRFTLMLPVELQEAQLAAARVTRDREKTALPEPLSEERVPKEKQFAGRRALLVEREVNSLLVETELLESLGFQIETAADGEEAQETLQEEPDCTLILIAEHLSPEATCDTIRAVRSSFQLPLVVLVNRDNREDHRRYLSAGADDLIAKPISRTQLEAVLTRLFRTATSASPSPLS